jgi:hypothetical protein
MAGVVSADGSGSVMDENGACLLSISKDRKVVLFDVSGSKICEVSTMVSRPTPSPLSSPQGKESRDGNDISGNKRIVSYENGTYSIGGEDCRAELSEAATDSIKFCKTYSLRWVFRSLELHYDLDSLEVNALYVNTFELLSMTFTLLMYIYCFIFIDESSRQ